MTSYRSWFGLVGSAAFLMGCGAGGTDGADGAPAYMGPFNGPGSTNGAAGAQPVGGAGTANNPAVNGQGGANGLTPAGTGGNSPSGGAGAGNNVNPGGAGTGNAGSGGQVGTGGSGNGTGGGFVSLPVSGGASAAFVCPEGATFGNPLTGMSGVQTVGAPSGQFFAFLEGPIWVGSEERLFFSDNASGPERIWRMDAPFTTPAVFMPNSGSNGLAIDNEDQLLVADQAADRITRVSTATPPQVLEAIELTGTPTPNDLILRSDENLYFTDPSRGFYRISPTGQLTGPITADNAPGSPRSPNGIVLSPDENTLYVGDVNSRFVATFQLQQDGAVDMTSGERFVDTMNGVVDGMAVDCAGNLYVGTENGVEVYSPAKMRIGIVPTGYSSNVTFGGPERRTLFVTSRNEIKIVTVAVPGLPN